MANTIQYATIFQNELDKIAIQEMLTGWMDGNSGKVKYNGGKEVKIPQLSVDGLANYDRAGGTGYTEGSAKFEYKTKEMTQDRGRKFTIDANDVDETGFVLTAGNIMGEFQRTKVIPEIDAYRLSHLAAIAMKVEDDANVEYSYKPSSKTIIEKIKTGIKTIRNNGYNGELMIHITYDALTEVEIAALGKLTSVTFNQGGIDTQVPSIDRCPLIATPQNRMYSKIKLNDGVSGGEEKGGYVKDTKGIECNFIIVPRSTPIAVTKQDLMRIFDPNTNQSANAWAMDYRRYHDIWVLDNKSNSIYANFKEAKPSE
ncbi:prophage protein [[Clostridium] sordellii]|uniref:hypothetical protein n=1 Tax=Paraclostridium sordellii TaxID=1505 RepID=UPI0005DAED53|nr:hypothetical protein [Paeniclostridium sordellii]CEP39646.1 prophage protein [[Clostridium] sordellii] [Paeniclostridium sordellii]